LVLRIKICVENCHLRQAPKMITFTNQPILISAS
jgi:hypothetical protein